MTTNLDSIRDAWLTKHTELFEAKTHDAIRLRMHRAFSWLQRANQFEMPVHADSRLLFSWITLNTLYAKHDSNLSNRESEWSVREAFLKKMVQQDQNGHIQKVLLENRKQCDRLLSEEHLIHSYWGDPTEDAARKARMKPRKIGKHYHAPDEIINVLLPLIRCISMLRSQLVHGLATYGSSANRSVVEAGAVVMFNLAMALLELITQEGLWEDDESWQPVPYPPMQPHFRRDS